MDHASTGVNVEFAGLSDLWVAERAWMADRGNVPLRTRWRQRPRPSVVEKNCGADWECAATAMVRPEANRPAAEVVLNLKSKSPAHGRALV